jgi:cation transport ATPase
MSEQEPSSKEGLANMISLLEKDMDIRSKEIAVRNAEIAAQKEVHLATIASAGRQSDQQFEIYRKQSDREDRKHGRKHQMVIWSATIVTLSILFCFYLIFAGQSELGLRILIPLLSGVVSFIGGYGYGRRNEDSA